VVLPLDKQQGIVSLHAGYKSSLVLVADVNER
jgi:hypothetical protein